MALAAVPDVWDVHVRFAEHHDDEDFLFLVEHYRPLARRIVRHFPRGTTPVEDINQAADEGLVGAILRFDPTRGCAFTTFAYATISGTIKRHLRNSAWMVRVPRRTRDLSTHVRRAVELLQQELQREPTATEVARWLGSDEEAVVETMEAHRCTRTWSLDFDSGDAEPFADALLRGESDLRRAEDRFALEQALSRLDEDDHELVDRYYLRNQSQSEIAATMGMSQTQVSRRLRHITRLLRPQLEDS